MLLVIKRLNFLLCMRSTHRDVILPVWLEKMFGMRPFIKYFLRERVREREKGFEKDGEKGSEKERIDRKMNSYR